jgi:hypothetical protein
MLFITFVKSNYINPIGSGKTYTMVGTPDNPGCMVRAMNDLFEAMDSNTDVIFKVISFFIIFLNKLQIMLMAHYALVMSNHFFRLIF